MLDILISSGHVIDGTGAARFRADVGIAGDRIVAVGLLEGMQTETILDATGCVVTPGFVDMHSHADFTLPILPTADSMVRQGITTTVVGQCGATPVPLLAETRAAVVESFASEDRPLPWDEWSSTASYLDFLGRMGTSLNVVPLVGQGTVRAAVMGFAAAPATAAQVARMQELVVAAMEEGAVGISTGLIYPPGSYAGTEELIAVTRPVGERDGLYFSHIRGEAATLLAAVAEAIRIGRETGARVQISHFKASGRANWDTSARALELIDRARAEGVDVTADMYPHLAGQTGLVALLPEWAQEGGKQATLARLAAGGERERMASEMDAATTTHGPGWDQVLIASAPRRRELEGRRIVDLAAETGQTPVEWVFDALIETELDADVVLFHSSEENRRRELRHPAMMIGTDGYGLATEGPLSTGKPHPRNFGCFPRVLGRFVREQGVLSLEEAILKTSGLPAQKLGWADRGYVAQGLKADVVVFNPDTVIDRATYEQPHQCPAGIRHVLVNGEMVVRDDAHTGARPGRVLRRM